MDTKDSRVKILIYEFFSFLCALGDNEDLYEIVLDAMENFRYVKHEPARYFNVVDTLKNDGNKDVKSRCLQFINALINTSNDLDRRIMTRFQFRRLGLSETLQRLEKSMSSNLEFMTQYNIYKDDELADDEEFELNMKDSEIPIMKIGNLTIRHAKVISEDNSNENMQQKQPTLWDALIARVRFLLFLFYHLNLYDLNMYDSKDLHDSHHLIDSHRLNAYDSRPLNIHIMLY